MRTDVVQHCFGVKGSGGPVMAMERLIHNAPIRFGEMRQFNGAGGLSFALLRRFVGELQQMRPELVHVRGLGNEGFHAALAARLAGVPNILVSVHGTHRDLRFPASRLKHWLVVRVLEPMTLSMATHIATVCEYAASRSFLQRYQDKLVAVVPNGVDLPLYGGGLLPLIRDEFKLPSGLPVALTVSRLTKEKGYLTLASALRQLDAAGQRFCLLIVGGGDDQGAIRAHFHGLNNIVVRFVGHRSDVARFLSQADFFVFPSLHENLSNALLEAMSHGLPVITTRTGGNTEVVSKGGGVLVPPGESVPLAEAIHQFLESVELRHRLGAEALEVVKCNYTIECMVQKWLSVYEKILGRRLETS